MTFAPPPNPPPVPPTGRVEISTAGRRTRWLFVAGLTGLAVVLMVAAIAADPDNVAWPAFLALIALVAVLDWLALRGRTWIQDTTLHNRRIGTQHADLARAASVQLRTNRAGGAQLLVHDHSGSTAFAELLSLPPATVRTAPPAALQQTAAALAAAPAPGAQAVSQLLHRQAQYVLAGGALSTSPLAPFATGRYGQVVDGAAVIGLIGR
jgi:hypothetical protein